MPISDVDALTLLLTIEGLLFAALGISSTLATNGGGQHLPVAPSVLTGVLSAVVAVIGSSILCAWAVVFVGDDYGGIVRLCVAVGVLLATLAQTMLAVAIFIRTVRQ